MNVNARGQSDVEHCHLLFHLPVKYCLGKRLAQVKEAILRLVELHGRGTTHELAVKLTLWPDPDGKYLIKGDGPKVWKKYHLRKQHRNVQGIIHGKRCGTTENLGPAARKRWSGRRSSLLALAERSGGDGQALHRQLS